MFTRRAWAGCVTLDHAPSDEQSRQDPAVPVPFVGPHGDQRRDADLRKYVSQTLLPRGAPAPDPRFRGPVLRLPYIQVTLRGRA